VAVDIYNSQRIYGPWLTPTRPLESTFTYKVLDPLPWFNRHEHEQRHPHAWLDAWKGARGRYLERFGQVTYEAEITILAHTLKEYVENKLGMTEIQRLGQEWDNG